MQLQTGGRGGEGGEGGVETGDSSKATTLPSRAGRAGNEMETLIEVRAGRQTSRSEVQGPYPITVEGEQLAGREGVGEAGVTETEVLIRVGLRSLICKQKYVQDSVQSLRVIKLHYIAQTKKVKGKSRSGSASCRITYSSSSALTSRCQVPGGMRAMLFCVMLGTVRM
jgi:hypothetical protein